MSSLKLSVTHHVYAHAYYNDKLNVFDILRTVHRDIFL